MVVVKVPEPKGGRLGGNEGSEDRSGIEGVGNIHRF
jgi:hypothetical protein